MSSRITNLNLFFSTPVWTSKIENYSVINTEILQYIKKLESEDSEGIQKSNLKGWHSPDFDLKNNEVTNYVNKIGPSLNEALLDMGWDLKNQQIQIQSMWSIINRSDAANSRHIHGNSFISAAYYLKAPKNCGDIVFHDPRSEPTFFHPKVEKPNKLNTNVVKIKPEEGLLILFPSYIYHSVESNKSNEERVVISFNINLK